MTKTVKAEYHFSIKTFFLIGLDKNFTIVGGKFALVCGLMKSKWVSF